MAILACIPNPNLFSSLPTPTSPPPPNTIKPPIPIPKYPPVRKTQKPPPPNPQSNPAFKTFHRRSKYYKPIREGDVVSSEGDRSVVVGESGVSYQLPGAPFEFQYSYSEIPRAKPIAIREPAFLPFAPPTMPRPWTGKAPLKKSTRKIKLFESLNPSNNAKQLEMLKPYELGNFEVRPREEVLGKPLNRAERLELVKPHISSNRQVNLGRDGLTHNMLELIHSHWRRDPVCKVRCLGVPTVDMRNVCRVLQEKTGGKIILKTGGVLYLFRGRHYDHKTRPQYPVMLWKPATPVYPKLIQEAPEGLTKEEADEMRIKGKKLPPICKLAKNGVYLNLVKEVRQAFEESPLVKIDCTGMHASDYKKLGAKLKELRSLMADDTTTLSYWLTWRFFLCALWIIIAMIGATILIIKYEVFTKKKTDRKDNEHDIEPIGILYEDETWKTSLKSLHPAWLLGYRLLAFGVMLAILIANLIVAGPDVFFFYTQWTFALVTLYFGIGSLLSIYGCYKNWNEVSDDHNNHIVDPETGNYMAPSEALSSNINPRKTAGILGYLFQIIFQTCGGAVGLTDSVFWFIIYPFLTPEEYSLNFLDVSMHSLNAILLIIDMSLNRLRFPFFRLAYFGLWTCIFVIFQWIVHACVSMWWPYSFLDLSSPYAPIWYLGVGLIHLPAYGIFALLVRGKQLLLSRFLDTNGA